MTSVSYEVTCSLEAGWKKVVLACRPAVQVKGVPPDKVVEVVEVATIWAALAVAIAVAGLHSIARFCVSLLWHHWARFRAQRKKAREVTRETREKALTERNRRKRPPKDTS